MMRSANMFYSDMETPIGHLTLVCTKKGLCRIDFDYGDSALQNIRRWSSRFFLKNEMQRDDIALQGIKDQLNEYFQGERLQFDCELDFLGTSFQKLVWNELITIPYGEVRSYKQVAQAIGSPKAVRAIGGANNKNNIPIVVPCHRVVGSNGALVGYGGGLHIKEKLLSIEGNPLMKKRKA